MRDRLRRWTRCDFQRGRSDSVVGFDDFEDDHELFASIHKTVFDLGGLAAKGGDVERNVGYRSTKEGRETLTFRAQALLDARAAGVPNPVTGLWTDLRDLDGLRRFTEESRALGYEGMMVIHPSHAAVVNEVFTPSPEELAYYEGLVAAADEALSRSGISAITFQGEMIDTAMVTTARQRLNQFRKG